MKRRLVILIVPFCAVHQDNFDECRHLIEVYPVLISRGQTFKVQQSGICLVLAQFDYCGPSPLAQSAGLIEAGVGLATQILPLLIHNSQDRFTNTIPRTDFRAVSQPRGNIFKSNPFWSNLARSQVSNTGPKPALLLNNFTQVTL